MGVIVCRFLMMVWMCHSKLCVGFCLVSLKLREGNCTVEYCESRDGAGVNENVGAQGLQLRSCVMAKCQQTRECSSAPRGTALSGWGLNPNYWSSLWSVRVLFFHTLQLLKNTTLVFICVQLVLFFKSLITSNGAASHVPKLWAVRIQFSMCVRTP